MVKTGDFPLDPLFHRLEQRFGGIAARRGLELRLVPSHAHIHSDPTLLAQILDHLVANAVSYTENGRVLVGCRRRGGRLDIEVWDTGPGLPADRRDALMAPLPRDRAEDAAPLGSGVGLSVVDRLARLLRLPLRVDSQPGRGTRFRLGLPRGEGCAPAGPRPLMVVIEDEEAVREGLRMLLEAWDFSVLATASGEEAVCALARRGAGRPDGIIADYRLREGCTGTEAVRRIRGLFRSLIPGIIITGETLRGHLRDAEASGLTVLQKPVAPPRLQHVLSSTLKSGN